jgi:hypothetical protein
VLVYLKKGETAPLVRPDKHIGGRSMILPHEPEQGLCQALTRSLSR